MEGSSAVEATMASQKLIEKSASCALALGRGLLAFRSICPSMPTSTSITVSSFVPLYMYILFKIVCVYIYIC